MFRDGGVGKGVVGEDIIRIAWKIRTTLLLSFLYVSDDRLPLLLAHFNKHEDLRREVWNAMKGTMQ